MKRSPFYELHLKAGAKIAEIAWATPMEYVGVKEEHDAVRNRAGITDFSSMGEIDIKGKDAFQLVQKLMVNDARKLSYGKVMYSSMLNHKGGMIDDTTVYCFSEDHYWIVTSTAGRFKSYNWIVEQSKGMNVGVTDISSGVGLLCFQGPLSRVILQSIVDIDLQNIEYFEFSEGMINKVSVLISRTGFTGELGYEIYVNAEDAYELWDALINMSKSHGILLCGMGAASGILPLEKGYLSGREYNEDTNPIEAGLGWTVRWDKGDFIGREALLSIKERGVNRKLIGFEMEDSTFIANPGSLILNNGKEIGKVTSGNFCYSVDKSIGMGYVLTDYAMIGTEIQVRTGGIIAKGKQVKKPFYDSKGKRLRV